MSKVTEEICRKLRATAGEFGQDKMRMDEVVVITPLITPTLDNGKVGGHTCIRAPTIGETTLGNCSYDVARFFEDI